MQTLERLRLSAVRSIEELRYRLDQYLDRIVQVGNHNALDREWVWTMEVPANGTYCIHVPNVARKVVGLGVVLQAGTCDVSVTQGAQTISWEAAAGSTLNVTTTEQIDRASSANKFVADEEVTNEVIDSPNSVVYDEAENRLHAQHAILISLMGDKD